MAEASSSRQTPEPKTLLQESSTDDADNDSIEERKRSSSTSKRHSYYEGQRTASKRSRPVSGESQPSKGKGKEGFSGKAPPVDEGLRSKRQSYIEDEKLRDSKRSSKRSSRGKPGPYAEPGDFANLDETERPPVDDDLRSKRQSYLEDERGQSSKNASKRSSAARKRASGRSQDVGLSEEANPPPLPSPSAAKQKRRPRDAERGHDVYSSDEAQPPAFAARKPEDYVKEKQPPPRQTPKWLTEVYTISYLIFWSIWGTLARLGVQWLTFYPGAPLVTPVLWANVGGSLLMGFLSEDQRMFQDAWPGGAEKSRSSRIKKSIPLYVGLSVGFCGCFTSFSSFERDVFLALSNNLNTPYYHNVPTATASTSSTISRNGGYSFMALLAVIFYTVALSLGALFVGAHLALAVTPVIPRVPIKLARNFFDPLAIILGCGCWLGAVFLAIWPPDRPGGPASRGSWSNETWRGEAIFACVFAPLGCLLRFYASIHLNGLVASFPLGTFGVNMLGTAIEGMCFDIQHVGVGRMGMAGGGRIGCQVLQGVMDGFCGSLTTVSTWVLEIDGLRRRHGYIYALASVIGGLCLMVVIMGSVRWSVGWIEPVCNTGYTSKLVG